MPIARIFSKIYNLLNKFKYGAVKNKSSSFGLDECLNIIGLKLGKTIYPANKLKNMRVSSTRSALRA